MRPQRGRFSALILLLGASASSRQQLQAPPPTCQPSAGGRNRADDGAILLLVLPREKNKTTKVKTSLKKKKSLVIVPALTRSILFSCQHSGSAAEEMPLPLLLSASFSRGKYLVPSTSQTIILPRRKRKHPLIFKSRSSEVTLSIRKEILGMVLKRNYLIHRQENEQMSE